MHASRVMAATIGEPRDGRVTDSAATRGARGRIADNEATAAPGLHFGARLQ